MHTKDCELWHKTTVGAACVVGYMESGPRDSLQVIAAEEYAEQVGANVTLHIVEAGSYAGFPEPSLGSHNEVLR